MHRILHVGVGPLGRMILADLRARGVGEVVAAVDVSPEIAGRSLGDLVPGADPGISIGDGLESIRDWSFIDCAIVTTSSSLEICAPTFSDLLARGLPVVSTCEELVFPWVRHETLARSLDQTARENRGRLLGTGVNPGFLMDAFPLFATAVSRSIESISVHRRQDASIRRLPFQRKIGVGLDPDRFAREVDAGRIRHVGLAESVHLLSHALGRPITRADEIIHPVIADRDLESALGPVSKGRVCGIRQEIQGLDGATPWIRLEFVAAIGLVDPHDRVVVRGDPPIDLTWKGGVPGDVATSSIVLNSLGPLRAAPPGLHTMITVPGIGHAAGGAPSSRATSSRRTASAPPRA